MKSKFRTTEISDPRFESNQLRHITVKSDHLKNRGDITVYVPSGQELSDLPITILLHGVYGSHWIWSQKTGIHLKMESWIYDQEITPMIVAMPSDGLWGDGSGYLPHADADFERWITDDVIDAVVELIPQASSKSSCFIAGLSMGGFGALRLGVKYHQKFAGISALSAITDIAEMKLFVEEPLSSYEQSAKENKSIYKTILNYKDTLPALRFDCGQDDLLIKGNQKLHRQLEAQNIPHIYKEYPGKHEWSYWEQHIKETMLFFDSIVRRK